VARVSVNQLYSSSTKSRADTQASETIYTSIIQPTLRKYETPIDLSIELISSIILLVYHFTLEFPTIRLQSVIQPRVERLAPLFSSVKAPIDTPSSKDIVVDLTQSDDDDEVKSAKETTAKETVGVIRQSTPRASKVQQLIQSCEKKSPALSTRDERPRSQLTRPAAAIETTHSSTSITTRTQRSKAISKLPPPAVISSSSREPTRPTSRPRVPVKASKDTQRQPTSRPPAPSVKSAGSILTESRPVPTASEANIVRADPPLVKSKSSNHLKSTKPYVTDIIAQRPVKSAPTRRLPTKPFAGDDPNSPRAKKLAHAAERAREIRERRRREPGVTPGEKRPPPAMSSVDAPGSKRTRISVVRD